MDEMFLNLINQQLATPVLDAFFGWISHKVYFSIPFLLVILWVLYQRLRRSALPVWLLVLLAIGLGDVSGNFLKHQTKKTRPCQQAELSVRTVDAPFRHGCSGKPNGMPSNHALNFFLLASLLGLLLRSWRWFSVLAGVALLVGVSRIYLGLHFPYQVLAGALIGLGLGATMAFILRSIPKINGLLQDTERAGVL